MAVRVALEDGSRHGEVLPVADFEDAERDPDAAVADAAQDTIMAVLWKVWPTCAGHGLGLHVSHRFSAAEGPRRGNWPEAVWWCTGDSGHHVSPVGGLGSSL